MVGDIQANNEHAWQRCQLSPVIGVAGHSHGQGLRLDIGANPPFVAVMRQLDTSAQRIIWRRKSQTAAAAAASV